MIIIINIKILKMKQIHNLILINVLYVTAYFGTVFQCQVLFLKIEVGSQVRF